VAVTIGADAESDAECDTKLMGHDLAPEHQLFLEDKRQAILRPRSMIKQDVSNKENVPLTRQSRGEEYCTHGQYPTTEDEGEDTTNTRHLSRYNHTEHQQLDVVSSRNTPSHNPPHESSEPRHLPENVPARLNPDSIADATITEGQVPWHVFVKAMTDARFAVTNCGDSMISFSKPGGGIIFHRPHLSVKLSKVNLLAMGKRIARRFG
jgi:hypothetical protein